MAIETPEKDISTAFEKLAITSNSEDHCITPATIFLHSKSKILAAIDEIKEKKRCPDINETYEYVMKSKASNADKYLIEVIIEELTKQKSLLIRIHAMD